MDCRSAPRISARKIRTFNIAPAWTRLINTNTIFNFGVWARQDQYNYYPSADPFADLLPTSNRNRRAERRLRILALAPACPT